MSYKSDCEPSGPEGRKQFATTRWSVVLAAAEGGTEHASEALAALCETYWYPLYAYIRRQGHNADEAQDLTQAFFARFLEKDYLQFVGREKGRFRSYLLASLKHFLSDCRDHENAQKRGGGRAIISIDAERAESQYRVEPVTGITPERIFERRWALTVLDQVLASLWQELAAEGNALFFDGLKECLSGEIQSSYRELASQLGMSESAVKVAVHRMRHRYRDLLREQITQTVASSSEVDDEIRHLFMALE